MIPPLIHQIWLDSKDDHAGPPSKYLVPDFCPSFKTHNPEFQYRLWTMADVKELLDRPDLSRCREFFHSLRLHIERCDFSRYIILWLFGGVYVDLDFRALRPLDNLLKDRDFVWTFDTINNNFGWWSCVKSFVLDNNTTSIFNGFLACSPRHPVMAELIEYIIDKYPSKSAKVHQTTGPASLGRFAMEKGFTQDKRPDLYVNPYLILPMRFNLLQNKQPLPEEPYVVTRWIEGTDWAGQKWWLAMYNITQLLFVLVCFLATCWGLRKLGRSRDSQKHKVMRDEI